MFAGKKWDFNHSPFFLDFLQGKREYCLLTWGNPNYSVLGWQKPCYLMADGYTTTFKELMERPPGTSTARATTRAAPIVWCTVAMRPQR